MKNIMIWGALAGLCLAPLGAWAKPSGIEVQGGIGFDTSLGGLAYGGGVSYLLEGTRDKTPMEVGFTVHAASSVTTEQDDTDPFETTYTTEIVAVAARWNALFNYRQEEAGAYFILGTGLGAVSLYHREKERSLSAGYVTGYDREVSGTALALILNPGLGINFGSGFGLRLELPIFTLFGEGGSTVAPTGTVMVGYRF